MYSCDKSRVFLFWVSFHWSEKWMKSINYAIIISCNGDRDCNVIIMAHVIIIYI